MRRSCKLVLASLVALLTVVVLVPSASAGTYKVEDCTRINTSYRTNLGWSEFIKTPGTNFAYENECTGTPPSSALYGRQVFAYYDNYPHGSNAKVRYSAPIGSGFSVIQAFSDGGNLSDDGLKAALIFHDNGDDPVVVPGAPFRGQYFTYTIPGSGHRTNFEERVKCTKTSGTCNADHIYTRLTDIVFTVNDYTPPIAYSGGTLFSGGVVSGTKSLDLFAIDGQTGIRAMFLVVNGHGFGAKYTGAIGTSCAPTYAPYDAYRVMRPCTNGGQYVDTVDTRQAPFVNGPNTVFVCAVDGSGGGTCLPTATVNVSN